MDARCQSQQVMIHLHCAHPLRAAELLGSLLHVTYLEQCLAPRMFSVSVHCCRYYLPNTIPSNYLAQCHLILTKPQQVGVISFILQIRTPRLREAVHLGKGHTAGERWSQDTNPGSPTPGLVWWTTLQGGCMKGAGSTHRGQDAMAEGELVVFLKHPLRVQIRFSQEPICTLVLI